MGRGNIHPCRRQSSQRGCLPGLNCKWNWHFGKIYFLLKFLLRAGVVLGSGHMSLQRIKLKAVKLWNSFWLTNIRNRYGVKPTNQKIGKKCVELGVYQLCPSSHTNDVVVVCRQARKVDGGLLSVFLLKKGSHVHVFLW
jgi:hypothetical protein